MMQRLSPFPTPMQIRVVEGTSDRPYPLLGEDLLLKTIISCFNVSSQFHTAHKKTKTFFIYLYWFHLPVLVLRAPLGALIPICQKCHFGRMLSRRPSTGACIPGWTSLITWMMIRFKRPEV